MAEEKDLEILEPEVSEEEEEKDLLFRLQMRVYDVFMRHWKKMLGVSIAFLSVVLVYSLWNDYVENTQREQASITFDIKRQFIEQRGLLHEKATNVERSGNRYSKAVNKYQELIAEKKADGLSDEDLLADTTLNQLSREVDRQSRQYNQEARFFSVMDRLNPLLFLVQPQSVDRYHLLAKMNFPRELYAPLEANSGQAAEEFLVMAKKFEDHAKESSGAAAFLAWLEAAEAWRLAGEPDVVIRTLNEAEAVANNETFQWVVLSLKANHYASQGEVDKSIELFSEFAANNEGYFAESALLFCALLHEEKGQNNDALAALSLLEQKNNQSLVKTTASYVELGLRLGK